jgi:hypothetical protein
MPTVCRIWQAYKADATTGAGIMAIFTCVGLGLVDRERAGARCSAGSSPSAHPCSMGAVALAARTAAMADSLFTADGTEKMTCAGS